MDNLRLILVISGVALLVGIYVWGVAFAKRRDARLIEDDLADSVEHDLDGIQDIRAAQNVDSLTNLENFDIDDDLEQDFSMGEPLVARKPNPTDVESEANEISTDDSEELLLGAEIQTEIDDEINEGIGAVAEADEGTSNAIREDDIPAVADIDFDPKVADLSGIRATRAADDEVPMGQLDLLRFDDETEESAPAEKVSGKRGRDREQQKATAVDATAVAITVMAREGKRFTGADLRHCLQNLGLEHGEMGIFHRREPGKSRRAVPVFSVANVVKPGTFDPGAMDDMTTPGVAMFIQLPGPEDPGAAFEEMIRIARKLAEGLNGVVCDETRSTLTGQLINHMRERISEFTRKQRVRL